MEAHPYKQAQNKEPPYHQGRGSYFVYLYV